MQVVTSLVVVPKLQSSSSVCCYVWSMETHSMSMADEIEPLRYTDVLSLFEFGA